MTEHLDNIGTFCLCEPPQALLPGNRMHIRLSGELSHALTGRDSDNMHCRQPIANARRSHYAVPTHFCSILHNCDQGNSCAMERPQDDTLAPRGRPLQYTLTPKVHGTDAMRVQAVSSVRGCELSRVKLVIRHIRRAEKSLGCHIQDEAGRACLSDCIFQPQHFGAFIEAMQ
ncbi:hypothetical protein AC578_4614 [Pseudocercospora eumusae]|uniref:Uncharacterized protein n=1 Tax=Pseudocercospora eumusae TaxID=321146 RepID=A0A139H4Z1_9PEZI|nr:hypothetical protein AC578_4614 [Pseudocercospora eumusae]